MTVQRAAIGRKTAPLSSEFGLKVACEKFGEELINSFPKFSRGPRKGMLKGFICWAKCSVGGWSHDLPDTPGRAGVVYPGTSNWRLTMVHPDADPNGHSVVARWTYVKGREPIIENLQTPQDAEELHKIYGSDKRYG